MAGFFGLFDYTKPGPGVPKDAPPKSRFFIFFEVFSRKFWKLCQLNIIYFIACLPIFTIGPATAGFTYVLRNFSREEHAWVWSDFKEHMKKNFKQGFIVSLINLGIWIVLFVNFRFYTQIAATKPYIGMLKYVVILIAVIFMMMHFYLYQMMVTFKLTIKQLYKNAFIFAIVKLPMNFLILVICGAILFGFYYYIIIGILLTPFLVLSIVGFIVNFYVYGVIKKYMIDKIGEDNSDTKLDTNEPVFEDMVPPKDKDSE